MKIVVLCGGLSPERNVSISSGTKIASALTERGHKVVLIDMFLGLEAYVGDIAGIFENPPALGGTKIAELAPDLEQVRASRKWKSPSHFGKHVLEVCAMADIVFLALHGRTGEDGRVQAAFDLLGIGVAIAATREELRTALLDAAKEGSRVVVEQYIQGREVQIGILDGKALPSIEIVPLQGFYDYKNKYQPGAAEEITPAPIPAETEKRLADVALTVFRTLGLQAYSRADFILDAEGQLWFLEINTLPGMTPTSLVPQEAEVVGIGYGELCEKIIEIALRK